MQRSLLLAASAALSILSMVPVAAAAAPQVPDAYCLQGRIWGYPGKCEFATYEQCKVTASGTDAYCGINPMLGFAQQRRRVYR